MNKVLVTIGSVSIYWYSVLILIAIILGSSIADKYAKKQNIPSNTISDMLLGLVISAIIGARIYFVIFNFSAYSNNLIDIFKIWEGGLAIYGGVIAGTLYILNYCIKHKLSFIKMLDICSLSLLLGQAIGRWGNFFNQEAYGRITTKAHLESLHIPDFIIKGMYIDASYRMPTFLYESLWCLIGVLILLYIRKRKSNIVGKQICFYMIWYGIGRFIIESMRTDSLYIGKYRISMIVSLLLIVGGIIGNIIIYLKKRYKRTTIHVGGNNGRI